MNLTAITEADDVARLHMLDCAALLNCADFAGRRLLDVGTGAGFPGVVLKILVPSLDVTLLDSLNKRLEWLEEVSHRAGSAGHPHRSCPGRGTGRPNRLPGGFDFVTSGQSPICACCASCACPLSKWAGKCIMKSAQSAEETNDAARAVSILGGRLLPAYDYTIPGTSITHRVVWKKPLPRPPGIPGALPKSKEAAVKAKRS